MTHAEQAAVGAVRVWYAATLAHAHVMRQAFLGGAVLPEGALRQTATEVETALAGLALAGADLVKEAEA